MPVVNVNDLEYEGGHLRSSDFNDGKDNGDTLQAGEVGEIATAEVGEDGQLSAYDAVRPGDHMDPTGNSPIGKMYVDLQTSGSSSVADSVELRLVARDKNANRRVPITPWFSHRDLANSDPRLRTPLPPVVREGQPFFVKDGRIISLEVKDETSTVEVTRANCTFEFPARFGY